MSDAIALADLLRWAADYGHAYVHANADRLAVQIIALGAAPAIIVGLFTRYAPLVAPFKRPIATIWRLARPALLALVPRIAKRIWARVRPWLVAIKRKLIPEDGK